MERESNGRVQSINVELNVYEHEIRIHTTVFMLSLGTPMVPTLHSSCLGSLQQLVGAATPSFVSAHLLSIQSSIPAPPQHLNYG